MKLYPLILLSFILSFCIAEGKAQAINKAVLLQQFLQKHTDSAQISFDKKQHRIMLKTMDSIFAVGFKNNVLKDSIAIYAINFELDIVKVKNGTEVKHINTNDKLGYILFPSFKSLYSINFSSLMGTQKKITLRIPILIINSSVEKRVYKHDDGSALIDLKAASNVSYALASNVPYDNIKQSKMNFQLKVITEGIQRLNGLKILYS